jgi:chemotaxis protein histidine kinase CheA
MLSREQRLVIFRRSLEENVERAWRARDALEVGIDRRTNVATLRRALHTIKSDARSARVTDVAGLLEEVERVLEAGQEEKDFEVDWKLVDAVLEELARQVKSYAAEKKHPIEKGLRERAKEAGRVARQSLRGDRVRRA